MEAAAWKEAERGTLLDFKHYCGLINTHTASVVRTQEVLMLKSINAGYRNGAQEGGSTLRGNHL